MFLTSSCTHSRGSSKRRRDGSSDQNIQRDEGARGLKPKLMIVHSQKPLRPHVLATKDNTLQTKTPRVDAVISVTPISAIHIQSVAMPPKTSDEGMSNVQGSKLNSGKAIFPPPDAVENIMDILDCDLNPTKCMGECSDMNFKEKLALAPLSSESHCFPSIEHLSSLG